MTSVGKRNKSAAEKNYEKAREYIASAKGGLEDWSDVDKKLTGDLLNRYAKSIVSAASENGNPRDEGVLDGVTEVIEKLLEERVSRSALSKMMEVFTQIVDLHKAAHIELFKGKGTQGLTDCNRMMTGE